ncbi:MAG: M1 family aminopeptidase, partial [archaeon]
SFGNTPKMMAFFNEFTGMTYPHAKYAQVAVADFIYGGMEHTTCTTQTDLYLQDEIARKEYPYPGEMLAAHELAHQWFGDLLTCRDWSHGWLNESFATYFESLWMEKSLGKDEFRYELYQNYKTYILEDTEEYRRPIVTNQYVSPSDVFDRHLYEKGALVLHSLRGMIGENGFRKSIQHYVKKHANQNVITEDLLTAIRETTGKNVTQWFDQFIYRSGHPALKTECSYDEKKKRVTVRIIQTQPGELYNLPLTIRIDAGKNTIREEKIIHEKENVFTFPLEKRPHNVVVDPDVFVLKAMNTIKPRDMWMHQLAHDPHVVHRISAALNLALIAGEDELLALENALKNDSFWGVRAEIATALG